MAKTYRCPKCDGTEIIWNIALRKSVCPKDRTPVDDYEVIDQQQS